jgi:hypothetical protein
MTTEARTDTTSPSSPPVLIDAHVHLYDCFDRKTFFNAASKNFQLAAQSLGLPRNTPACLMLAETSKNHAFKSLIEQRETNNETDNEPWQFNATHDHQSLTASHQDRNPLTIIAGRQIITREGLEVLALCCNETFTDGLAIEDTLSKVIDADALPVLPYGIGKWTGKRGDIINKLLTSPLADKLFLGDNAGRLAIAGEPKQLTQARKQKIWTLPGTDTLPFPSQASGVGRFGLVLDCNIDPTQPAASIKARLSTLTTQPKTFGQASGPLSFLSLQFAMQLRKRLRKKA